jgi:hypothetical protein
MGADEHTHAAACRRARSVVVQWACAAGRPSRSETTGMSRSSLGCGWASAEVGARAGTGGSIWAVTTCQPDQNSQVNMPIAAPMLRCVMNFNSRTTGSDEDMEDS